MRVVVTGGTGLLGRHVVEEFDRRGYIVLNLDRVAPKGHGRFMPVELTDIGQVYDALAMFRPQALVHLAANPKPKGDPRHELFLNNMGSAHAVFLAATDLGVRKIAYASSEMANGWTSINGKPDRFPWNEDDVAPLVNTYALTKRLGEHLLESFCARHPDLVASSLRVNGVVAPDGYHWIPAGRDHVVEGWSGNMWAYVDAEDAAVAFRLAIEDDRPGHRAYMIAAEDTYLDLPTREALSLVWGGSVNVDPGLGEFGSCVDCSRICRELGWKPGHSWRTRKAGTQPREVALRS